MNVGEDAAGGDGDTAEELVELLVVLDGEGDVPGNDAGLLVVAGGVAGELEDLGAEVLEEGGELENAMARTNLMASDVSSALWLVVAVCII